jgi:hypothetical protein
VKVESLLSIGNVLSVRFGWPMNTELRRHAL